MEGEVRRVEMKGGAVKGVGALRRVVKAEKRNVVALRKYFERRGDGCTGKLARGGNGNQGEEKVVLGKMSVGHASEIKYRTTALFPDQIEYESMNGNDA